jgi:CRISPR-associated protein Cas6
MTRDNDLYWQEDEEQEDVELPRTVQDLLFRIDCRTLPLDHAEALSTQIRRHLPWLDDEPLAAIHLIHVAESANGWMRPEDPDSELLHVSRRTRMTLRLPSHRFDDARALVGRQLDIAGHPLTVGDFHLRPLSKLTTIFARHVDTGGTEDEAEFMRQVARELADRGIRVKKMMPGKLHRHRSAEGDILTRKLMLSDLQIPESLQLQEQGLGRRRLMGMGIFLPHKGIEAVNKKQQ